MPSRWNTMLAATALFAALTTPMLGQQSEEQKAPPVDPSGTWKWEATFNENTLQFSLKLHWDGKALTGKYTSFGETVDIVDGTVAKDEVSFAVRREFNGNEFGVKFRGTVGKDAITGTVNVEFGGETRQFDWNPRRVVEMDDVLGTWQLRVETPDGQLIEPTITVAREEEALTGEHLSPRFGKLQARNVQLKENKLSWEITASVDGREFTLRYEGVPRGNAIEGTAELVGVEQTPSIPFTGKKLSPQEDS